MKVHSASSINLYKQCPRKYYYKYIQKLPEPPSIHTVRGNIVHEALEEFFTLNPEEIQNFTAEIPKKADRLLDKHWIKYKEKLKELGLPVEELQTYYTDSRDMITKWSSRFLTKVEKTGLPFPEAFKQLTPSVEEHLKSEEIGVQGFIDALYKMDDGLHIVDYKTSRKDIVTPEYTMQAGIYAVLVHEIKGEKPITITFDFLKGEERDVPVTEELFKATLFEIEQMHMNTQTTDITDYPKKPSGLCKWQNARGSGQCAFYDICEPFKK